MSMISAPSKGATIRAIAALALARPRPSAASFSTFRALRDASGSGRAQVPPYGPVGVARALELQASPSTPPEPTLFAHEFSLADRVALVTGANRGIGLEIGLALVEAGARAVYCVDLPKTPGEEWAKVGEYTKALGGKGSSKTGGEGRLEYVGADVTDQEGMWRIGKMIGDREGRMDACVAAAGILPEDEPCLTYSAKHFQQVLDVNVNGVLFTAQAAGQQMERFGGGGSIIMIASTSGHMANGGYEWLPYNTSKSAVLQMARTMACELAGKGIRVNSISPGGIRTTMTKGFLSTAETAKQWADGHLLGRVGRPDELRGAAVWLASDASSFCTGSDYFVSGGYQAW